MGNQTQTTEQFQRAQTQVAEAIRLLGATDVAPTRSLLAELRAINKNIDAGKVEADKMALRLESQVRTEIHELRRVLLAHLRDMAAGFQEDRQKLLEGLRAVK